MLRAIVLGAVMIAGAATALASEPGQPITCDDAVLVIPGLRLERFLEPINSDLCANHDYLDSLHCGRSVPTSRQDAEGSAYALHLSDRWELWRTRTDGVIQLVAHLPWIRPAPGGGVDASRVLEFYLEPVGGSIYIRLGANCSATGPCSYPERFQVCRITGLSRLVDVVRQQLDLPPGLAQRP